ncbi:hypothetical protein ACHAXM_004457 [Skeletonema potamos]
MPKKVLFTRLKVISASYGPSDGRRLLDGSTVDHNKLESYVPYTRDVLRFLNNEVGDDPGCEHSLCHGAVIKSYSLMQGRSMNVVFGDPCPGSTKVLRIIYVFQDYFRRDNDPGYHVTPSRTFSSTFAEHEQILLRRQDPLLLPSDDVTEMSPTPPTSTLPLVASSTPSTLSASKSELMLPIIFPFLSVRQRARCQLVCVHWREIVLSKGITAMIDINDHVLFPLCLDISSRRNTVIGSPIKHQSLSRSTCLNSISNTHTSSNSSSNHPHRLLLRGLVKNSHSSLTSLILNDFLNLDPTVDIHPTLPHLSKLKRIDVSRIPLITDDTIHLISTHIGKRLEVLYMKGCHGVSDDGIVQLVRSCNRLKVLDVSHMHQLTDKSGVAIGQNLTELETFHGRDNKVTNDSVDEIFLNCKKLCEATFWGCIKLTHVGPDVATTSTDVSASNLVLLNLWGCIGLTDDCVARLSTLTNLRSLCVSECHKLTDKFVLDITQKLPKLQHLQMRYLKRITDESMEAISSRLSELFSLDLSFCTKLTFGGLNKLLMGCRSLSELRLYSCTQLNVEGGPMTDVGGRQLLQAIRQSSIAFLDLRRCQQYQSFSRDLQFLNAMKDLGYNEAMAYLFVKKSDPAVVVN